MQFVASLRDRALNPPLRFGRGVIASEAEQLSDFVVLTQDPVLGALPDAVTRRARAIELVESLEEDDLKRLVTRFPRGCDVFGIGGGVVMDAAKYVAWKARCRLYLGPSVVAADACVTNTIALRHESHVSYDGFVVADAIDVDPLVIRTAPTRLNRSGLGDLLSIHTGVWDWEKGASRGLARFVPSWAAESREVLATTAAVADDIRDVSDHGIEHVVRSYARVNCLVVQAGHSQMQEGSEHYFAYAMEAATRRSFVHGEILGLGAVLMSLLQRNNPGFVVDLLERCGVAWVPAELGLTDEQVVSVLAGLKTYVEGARLPYSVANEATLSQRDAMALVGDALALKAAVRA